MWIRKLTLTLTIAAGLIAGSAWAGLRAPEEAIETSTAAVILPRSIGGVLLTKPCDVCKAVSVTLESDTRLFIGKQQVTLPEFNKFLDSGGPYGLTIFYDRQSFAINRIKVRAKLARS
jgi:hypothetical protein